MQKTLKDLFEVYRPKSPDEQKFVDKHVTIKHKDRNGNDDDVFNAKNVKYNKRKEERHGYDAGEDEKVYEEVEDLDEMMNVATHKLKALVARGETDQEGMSPAFGMQIKAARRELERRKKAGIKEDLDESYEELKRLKSNIERNQKKMKSIPGIHPDKKRLATQIERDTKKHKELFNKYWNKNEEYELDEARPVNNPEYEEREKAWNKMKADFDKNQKDGKYMPPKKTNEDVDFAFFEDLLEMNLDEDTFTDASLANLRVIKHKQMMKDIEKSTKIHPLMKVRRMSDAKKKLAELEKARDHYVAKHEKAQSKKKRVAEEVELDEKTLTPAEMKKREEIAKAMERENPGMPMAKKMAIATAAAKRVAEEAEDLEEISKATMGRYVNKAKDSIDLTAWRQGYKEGGANNPSGRLEKKLSKRHKGIETAVKKLTKEEAEQVDEISTKLALDYTDRASDARGHRNLSTPKLDKRYKSLALAHKKIAGRGVTVPTNEEADQIDELSKSTLGSYTYKAAKEIGDKGVTAGLKIQNSEPAGKDLNKMGRRMRGVAVAVKKMTKEQVINNAIDKFMPELEDYKPMAQEEKLVAKLDGLSESHTLTLLSLFESLNEDNRTKMLMIVDTREGVNSLLDFALQNRGE